MLKYYMLFTIYIECMNVCIILYVYKRRTKPHEEEYMLMHCIITLNLNNK